EMSFHEKYTEPYPTDTSSRSAYGSNQYNLGYIELPLLVKEIFPSGFHVEGGFFTSYQIHQKYSGGMGIPPVDSLWPGTGFYSESNDITAKRFQGGFRGGIGCIKSGIDVSLEAQYALTSLFDIPPSTEYSRQHLLNVVLCLSYQFNLKKKVS